MRQMGHATLERVVQHIASLHTQPAAGDVDAEALCRAMREPAPEEPTALEPLLEQLFEEWVPRSYTASGPGYLAYIPGGGLFPAALADLIADGVNRYTGVWQAAPALVQLEANMLSWMREWMGFPAQTRGLLTTGGSMATFNGVLCARERLLGAEIRPGVLYTSTQAHHSVLKAARLAGVMADRVRSVAVDSDFRLDLDALAAAIDRDRRAGLRPFMVVTSAGTTNTGAVDPLDDVAELCQREGLWQHVDGAYGGFFHLCEPLRPLLRGLSRADSLTLDPHKGLFLPFGTGALLVRDGEALRAVHTMEAGYLPGTPDPEAFYDPSQYGPELSRGFPGLRVWLCLKIFGVQRFRAALQEKRELALWACERAGQIPGLQIVARPQLSLFAFQLCPPGADQARRNAATRELLERVNARGQVLLTGCVVDDGRFLGRVCVLGFRTRRDRVETCVEQLEQAAATILAAC
jgi:aromatic-L-amino-acid decarboxylase